MIRKIALLLFAALLPVVSGAEVWQARYGTAETFNFKLYNADGTLDVDEADGGAEVSVSCNEGAETTATNDFVDEGTFYSIALTAAELQCERVAVVVAATTTEVFFIQTVGNASAMTPFVPADVQQFGGAAGTFASGRPEVNTSHWGGTAVASATVGANITQISGDATAADNLEFVYDDTPGASRWEGVIDRGTAQAATSTSLQLRSAAAFADDEIIGATCVITSGSAGVGQARTITDYVSSTDTATVGTWTTTPTGTIGYKCYGTAAASGGGGATAADVWAYGGARTLTALDEDTTTIDINATAIGSVAGAVGSVATGGITSGSFAAGAINAAAVAADAIGASELAADAGTEIGTATWATTTRVLTAGTNIALAKGTGVTGFNDLDAAGIRAAMGLSTANLDTQLSGLSSATAVIDAIVDQLLIGVNVTHINEVEVLGAGTTADPWNGE